MTKWQRCNYATGKENRMRKHAKGENSTGIHALNHMCWMIVGNCDAKSRKNQNSKKRPTMLVTKSYGTNVTNQYGILNRADTVENGAKFLTRVDWYSGITNRWSQPCQPPHLVVSEMAIWSGIPIRIHRIKFPRTEWSGPFFFFF